jgi:glycine cleavage system H protein
LISEESMTVPNDRRYLATHEWHKLENGLVIVGITQDAADELTDVTYVNLPKVGARLEAGKPFGEIESVKATSDLMCGVGGSVVEINAALATNPGVVNSDPFSTGWMIKIKPDNPADVNKLMPAEEYQKNQ